MDEMLFLTWCIVMWFCVCVCVFMWFCRRLVQAQMGGDDFFFFFLSFKLLCLLNLILETIKCSAVKKQFACFQAHLKAVFYPDLLHHLPTDRRWPKLQVVVACLSGCASPVLSQHKSTHTCWSSVFTIYSALLLSFTQPPRSTRGAGTSKAKTASKLSDGGIVMVIFRVGMEKCTPVSKTKGSVASLVHYF